MADYESLYQPFFDKFQRELLLVANSEAGRSLFRIPDKEKIVKLSPNSYHTELDKGIYKATFRCYELYSAIVHGGLPSKKIKSENHIVPFIARKNRSLSPFFHLPMLSVNSFYSGAGDGHLGNHQSYPNYVTARDAATATHIDYTSATGFAMITQNNGGGGINYRSFFPIDTSTLGAASAIRSAIFSAMGSANYSDTDGKSVHLVQTNQATVTELVAADYDNVTKTDLATAGILLHLANESYNDWTMNSTGIGVINRAGYTKLGLMGNVDLTNSNTDGPACGHSIYMSEQTGTTKDPKLTVT